MKAPSDYGAVVQQLEALLAESQAAPRGKGRSRRRQPRRCEVSDSTGRSEGCTGAETRMLLSPARATHRGGQRDGGRGQQHPGGCWPARQDDEPGGRAGAGAQPDSAVQLLADRCHLLQRRPAAEPHHHRVAGRGDEDPHAAHRQRVEPLPAAGARSGLAMRQAGDDRDGGLGDRARQDHHRGHQGPAHPHPAQLARSRNRNAGGTRRGRQSRVGPAAPARLSRGWAGQYRDQRRRRGHRSGAGEAEGDPARR